MLLIGVVLCTITGVHTLVNIWFILFFTYLLIQKQYNAIIFIFVALLPTNGFIDTEDNLIGIIHTKYILYFFSIYALSHKISEIKSQHQFAFNKDNLIKMTQVIVVYLFVYTFLLNFKLIQLGLDKGVITATKLLTRSMMRAFEFTSIYLVLELLACKYYKQLLSKAYILSLIILSLGVIFYDKLEVLGLSVRSLESSSDVLSSLEVRRQGLWGLSGDVNSLGGFLVIGLAFLLFQIKTNIKWVCIPLILLACIFTGSRTAILNIGLVSLIYLFSSKISAKIKIANTVAFLFIISFIYYMGYFEYVFDRINDLADGTDTGLSTDNQFGRLGGWLFYLGYIFSDFYSVLFGAAESIYSFYNITFTQRVAHNFYIQNIYYFGIFFFIFLSSIIGYSFVLYRRYKSIVLLALLVPFAVTLMTVSDFGVFYSFIIAVALIQRIT